MSHALPYFTALAIPAGIVVIYLFFRLVFPVRVMLKKRKQLAPSQARLRFLYLMEAGCRIIVWLMFVVAFALSAGSVISCAGWSSMFEFACTDTLLSLDDLIVRFFPMIVITSGVILLLVTGFRYYYEIRRK